MTEEKLEYFELDYGDGTKLKPPFIQSCHEVFENKVSLNQPDKLDAMVRLNMMQAYYSGFSKAMGLIHSIQDTGDKEAIELFRKHIRKELEAFSSANRDIGKRSGMGHVKVKS